jgi:hypothetical protein
MGGNSMSYYTRLEIEWDDSDRHQGENIQAEVIAAAEPFVSHNRLHTDVLKDLKDALRGFNNSDIGFKSIPQPFLEAMMLQISRTVGNVTFYVRGAGEEFGDIWMRKIRDGNVVFSRGPFNEGSSD